ncbi:MAG: toll/interleukin-1 receptor domain-containing protein [Clostridia bacterium]|nr:toll/interleukin-1 receptor domain-containing protein [Clostridia bacterium]
MQFNGLSAYKGDKPYIFVSYAHADSEKVFPLLEALQKAGYRIWFDQGIEAGTEWSNNIAEHLSGCSGFLFFTSKNSVKSENCLDEVAYAKSHNKQALLAYLEEEVTLPSGTDMQTARFQRLYVNRQVSIDGFVENFMAASIFDMCRGDDEKVEAPSVKTVTQTKPEKKKSGNKALFAVLAAAIVLLAVLAVVFSSGDKGNDDQSGETLPSDTVESTVAEKVELSDSLEDNTFRLDGVVYRVPVSLATLKANGWFVAFSGVDVTTEYIGGQQKEYMMLTKGGKKIDVTVYNDGENAKMIKDCQVVEVSVNKNYGVDFCISGGLTADATVDELIEAFGVPDERNDYDDTSTLYWYPSETSKVKAFCYNEGDTGYNSLSIYNCIPSKESFAPKQEAPSYLDSYIEPTELGDNLYSGVVSMEGALYQLPVPVRKLLGNGWTVAAGEKAVMSGGTTDITLKKGESTLYAVVENPSMYKTTLQNCMITEIRLDAADKINLILPGDISFGMSKEELEPCLPEDINMFESDFSISYSHLDFEERDFYMNLSIKVETDSLNEVVINCAINKIIVE